MSNHINEILFALSDAGVEFVVGGGVASVLHGVQRSTLDTDIAADMQPANIQKLLRVMEELRLRPRVPIPATDLMSREAVRRMVAEKGALVFSFIDPDRPLRQVDIFLTRDLSFEQLRGSAESIIIEGRTIWIMGIDALLKTKKAIKEPRDKDLIDIKELKKLKEAREEK